MTPRTKEQNEEIRLRRLAQIRKAAADVFWIKVLYWKSEMWPRRRDSAMARYTIITAIKAIYSTICYGMHWSETVNG